MRAQSTNVVVIAIVALIVGLAIGYVVKPSAPAETQTVTQTVTAQGGGAAPQTVTVTKTVTAQAGQTGGGQQTVTVTQTVTQTATVAQAATGLPEEIRIGALLPLTGDLSTFGENNEAALRVAEEDINKFLEAAGLPVRVKIVIEDTETKPDVALQKLQALYSQGIQFVVGPMSSAELRNIKGYADSNKILLVSQSSTSPALAIPDDYAFRLVTDDTFQGKVIAGLIRLAGIEHVVIMWRGDDWGDGLADSTKKNLEAMGIMVHDGPRYAPEAKEFSAEVSQLANTVQQLVNNFGADKVGVVLISFQEGTQIMIQASQYDVLSQVRWYGSDGIAKDATLIADPIASEFAMQTKFMAPIAAATKSPKFEHVKERVVQLIGREPESYAYNSYDAAWLIALSILITGKYDAEAVKAIFPMVAENYFGASGWTKLNEAGDRAFANYNIWTVGEVDGKIDWLLAGVYDTSADTFTPAE